jgi:hypothetical protein
MTAKNGLKNNYIYWLIGAIETYTKKVIESDSNSFLYKGMDLRYAIERMLYINLINSKLLFTHYLSTSSDSNAPDTKLEKESFDLYNFYLYSSQYFWIKIFFGSFLIRWLVSLIRSIKFKLSSILIKHKLIKNKGLLVYISHPKFERYFEPIQKELKPIHCRYVYSGKVNSKIFKGISENKNIYFDRRFPPFEHFFLNKTLKNFYGIIELAEDIVSGLQKHKPIAVLVVEGNAPEDIIICEACKLLSIPIFCLQQGWSPIIHNGFRNMSFDDMFVWGDGFKKLLAPFNPMQKFTSVGSHILNMPGDEDNAIIGDDLRISFFLQAPSALISEDNYRDFIELILWAAQEFKGAKFLIREHPNYSIPAKFMNVILPMKNVEISIPSESSLSDAIMKSTLVVSIFSTVILESISMGVVPLICSIGSMESYGVELYGSAIEVKSIEEAKKVLSEVILNSSYLQKYSDNLQRAKNEYFINSGDSARIIANTIKSNLKIEV